MLPQISVILPTYNRADIINRAINSVLGQSFEMWELIIIDDGSSDNTRLVVEKYLTDGRIKYFFQANQGVVAAINYGINKASSEIITFLGSDDWYKPDHLLVNYNYLQVNPAIDLIHSNVEVIGSSLAPDYTKPGLSINLDKCYIEGTFFIRQRVFKKVAFTQNQQIAEGYRFVKAVHKYGFFIKKINTRTYIYDRTRSDSILNRIR